jgi:hypothetical protein
VKCVDDVPTEAHRLIRAKTAVWVIANDDAENPYSKNNYAPTCGLQTELRLLRNALWDAINSVEENASGAPIERDLVILDRVADALGSIMSDPTLNAAQDELKEA